MSQSQHNQFKLPQVISCARRLCATCGQWGGDRTLGLRDNESVVLCVNGQAGSCSNGAWRNFGSLAHQYCSDYRRWELLAEVPVDPVAYSPVELLIRQIRMSSDRAGPLPEEFIRRIDTLVSDIESWHFLKQLSEEHGVAPSEAEVFYAEVVSGLFDALFYLSWSKRKPVSEITVEDFYQLG